MKYHIRDFQTTLVITFMIFLFACAPKVLVKNCDKTESGKMQVCEPVIWWR